jgi:site-specific DNA-methyltransferase (adenine-specific)
MPRFKLYTGDCIKVLRQCPDSYFDSIVCDPPYGLSFMGKKWDYDVPSMEIWKECLRVLKPGGHLLAFGGTRTYHRLVVAIEDAGFEIRDQIQWIYGQGFPKSQDISKAIDKAAGAEREQGALKFKGGTQLGVINDDNWKPKDVYESAPATPDAQKWSGWGTALKPANEPICLARKPLSESTIAKNVLKHGTGGLNIDGTRIGSESLSYRTTSYREAGSGEFSAQGETNHTTGHKIVEGRFPANVIFDEDAAKVLDEQSGVSLGAKPRLSKPRENGQRGTVDFKSGSVPTSPNDRGDSGGASRFFYIPKVSSKERGDSTHPTMKPIKLMEYLIKLVTPEGGTVLDPFMGSGTTGVAAVRNGFQFRGIELDEKYVTIAQARIEKEIDNV